MRLVWILEPFQGQKLRPHNKIRDQIQVIEPPDLKSYNSFLLMNNRGFKEL